MGALKTQENDASVEEYLDALADPGQRDDALTLIGVMQEASGVEPKMWGANIVGFGRYHYKYASGREGDWFRIGFAPRKGNLALYVASGFAGHAELLGRLGKHRAGVSCLTVRRLADVDVEVLRELLAASLAHMDRQYGPGCRELPPQAGVRLS